MAAWISDQSVQATAKRKAREKSRAFRFVHAADDNAHNFMKSLGVLKTDPGRTQSSWTGFQIIACSGVRVKLEKIIATAKRQNRQAIIVPGQIETGPGIETTSSFSSPSWPS